MTASRSSNDGKQIIIADEPRTMARANTGLLGDRRRRLEIGWEVRRQVAAEYGVLALVDKYEFAEFEEVACYVRLEGDAAMERQMSSASKQIERTGARRMTLASSLLAAVSFATPALSQSATPTQSPAAQSAANPSNQPPGENNRGGYADPIAAFNEPLFTFNLKLDDWVLRPLASGYATITPQPVRESVGRFFDNVRVIPRFAIKTGSWR